MSDDTLVKTDSRGRVSIGAAIRKNGIEPSAYWRVLFGPNQNVILEPVRLPDATYPTTSRKDTSE